MTNLEREMIRWGKLLFERRLISGWGGNLSCRLGKKCFLITGQHAPLGFLSPKDLVAHRSGRQTDQHGAAGIERNADAYGRVRRHRRAGDRPRPPAHGSRFFADPRKLRAGEL